ncbi:MAG: glycosyltransferase family 39 protein [Candidatus Peribacteraceae bacterium]|nr:glycosyltransferase family 39 protein [Candidatus Peribacteraceae bacterium]
MRLLANRWFVPVFLCAVSVVLFLLWLPGLRFPITSDTTVYALLAESMWKHGTYVYQGVPYAKHLPLHPILSYPFVWALGYHAGMKLSSLLAGIGTLWVSFFLLRRSFSVPVAVGAVSALVFHHGFVLMTMLGSADLLFVLLFLASLLAFLRAERDARFYLLCGGLAGLASLTRYNALALFPLFLVFVFWKRRKHLRSRLLWSGLVLGAVLFGLWLLRNALVFGSLLHSDYGGEFSAMVPSPFRELLRSVVYYLSPLHNILPVLLLLACWGLLREGKRQSFLLLALLAAWALSLFWWVKGMRFMMAGYPILLGFAFAGVFDLWKRFPRSRRALILTGIATALFLHVPALCLYTYGACNAWFDRTIDHIPADLGLSSEGLYGIALAKEYINAHAPQGGAVLVRSQNFPVWKEGVFRPDLRVIGKIGEACPSLEIVQSAPGMNRVVFATHAAPLTLVLEHLCPPR